MRITTLIIATLSAMTLAACETVQGAGEDISNAGAAISEESRDVQADL
ncbi:Entericidin EcnA/B family protein [Yoonia rosea]|jgi:predicted small secreted protein|uniref:Entericidin EcnA/B family protein n=1 Tax=Yoonia rosea TaxID=287098 RepID=A0A1R3XGD6_9RHOB|nr:entericidin A/B family lipoprotein [Yoonia rosea]SIT90359.1 Entericidin EcnA/B family protein [Yoonia rosea]